MTGRPSLPRDEKRSVRVMLNLTEPEAVRLRDACAATGKNPREILLAYVEVLLERRERARKRAR